MQRVLQVKDREEHNQKLWIGPLIPLQRHSFCLMSIIIFPIGLNKGRDIVVH